MPGVRDGMASALRKTVATEAYDNERGKLQCSEPRGLLKHINQYAQPSDFSVDHLARLSACGFTYL